MLDKILVLDMDSFGSVAVARKLRSQHFFCKILPGDATISEICEQDACGIIWVGVEGDLRLLDRGVLELDIPLLALGAAACSLAEMLDGSSEGILLAETTACVQYDESQMLLQGLAPGDRWFARAERLELSDRMRPIAWANGGAVGFCDKKSSLYGLQFAIERNDTDGIRILNNFCQGICGCNDWWQPEAFIERASDELKRIAGDGYLICALSGGVDSSVAAVLCKRAVGDRLRPVFIDTGMLEADTDKRVETFCQDYLGVPLIREDARELFLERLKGMTDACGKETVVRDAFREVLLSRFSADVSDAALVLGTNYSEILEYGGSYEPCDGYSAFRAVVTPLSELFKDEVRNIGEALGLPAQLVQMQSFPKAGLAARILGEVTADQLDILRSADRIFNEEICAAGQDRRLSQYYAMLQYAQGTSVVLRALTSGEKATAARLSFDLLGRVVDRIGTDLPGVKHILYDLTAE